MIEFENMLSTQWLLAIVVLAAVVAAALVEFIPNAIMLVKIALGNLGLLGDESDGNGD